MRGSGTLPLNSAPEKSKPGCCGGQCSGWIGWVGGGSARARYCGRCLLQHGCFAQLQSAGLQCRPQLASCPAACEHFGDPVCSRRLQALTVQTAFFFIGCCIAKPLSTHPPPDNPTSAWKRSSISRFWSACCCCGPSSCPASAAAQVFPPSALARQMCSVPSSAAGPGGAHRAGQQVAGRLGIFLLSGIQKEGLCIREAPPPCRNRRRPHARRARPPRAAGRPARHGGLLQRSPSVQTDSETLTAPPRSFCSRAGRSKPQVRPI